MVGGDDGGWRRLWVTMTMGRVVTTMGRVATTVSGDDGAWRRRGVTTTVGGDDDGWCPPRIRPTCGPESAESEMQGEIFRRRESHGSDADDPNAFSARAHANQPPSSQTAVGSAEFDDRPISSCLVSASQLGIRLVGKPHFALLLSRFPSR